MKKAVMTKYGSTNVLQIIRTDSPIPKTNQVVVKVKAAALNPKDILIRKGKFKRFTGNQFPKGIGFDFAGIVEDANHSVYQKGDKVFGMLNGWKGACCAEFVAIPDNELYLMPKNISFEAAAGVPLAGQTALQAIRDLGQLQKGQKILINGASGGVGTLALQIAKDLGGIVTSVSSHRNIDLCQSLGADIALDYNQTPILELKETFDVFFDVFGNYSFKKIIALLSKNGRYITTVPKAEIIKEQFWNFFRKKKAKLVVVKSKTEDLKYFAKKIEEGRIKPIVDKVFPLEEIGEAQKYIETKRAKGKVVLRLY